MEKSSRAPPGKLLAIPMFTKRLLMW